jgi:hypothetical protein
MSVHKIRSLTRKDWYLNGLDRSLKIDPACPIYLWDRSFSASKTTDPSSLLHLMESNFAGNLCTLSRGVLPTDKYAGFFPISRRIMF